MMWGFFEGSPLTVIGSTTFNAYPRWLHTGEPPRFVLGARQVIQYESLADACFQRAAKSVCFFRSFALGDILMLLPIVRALKRDLELDRVAIVCRDEYAKAFRLWRETGIEFHRYDAVTYDYRCDINVGLNRALECDHWGGPESDMHRCELYGAALGMEIRR